MNKPSLEEARIDLTNIREEVAAMQVILDKATWLSNRVYVNQNYYKRIANQALVDAASGQKVEQMILNRYPELI